MTRNQIFAAVSSVIYFAAGLIGFAVTGFGDFAGSHDAKILILALNPLHNVVHLVLGAVWLAAAVLPPVTRTVNIVLGAGLLAAFALGVTGAAGFLNIHGVSEPDNYLHLGYGVLSIAIGWRFADTPQPLRGQPA
ncbi:MULTISPECIES: DUF4383 domain-containing protein [unclassified Nocardia]|uniref:DUF4383 domain-containing protein n=1 Tax=unclassified Nocardia TaxID=2637762 RepID=UPI00278BDAD8|nr:MULTISPECIES: DUF4383 domain-containing protein [unclassified Nocardia]